MSTRVVSVPVFMNQEEVADIISKYDFLAVPVVTPNNILVGIVTVDDVIDVLEDETTEDFEEMMAAKGTADLDISSFEAAKKTFTLADFTCCSSVCLQQVLLDVLKIHYPTFPCWPFLCR